MGIVQFLVHHARTYFVDIVMGVNAADADFLSVIAAINTNVLVAIKLCVLNAVVIVKIVDP